MKGEVLDFSVQTNSGIISASDGNRYDFSGAEWMENTPPTRGCSVDFNIDGGNALSIYHAVEGSKSGNAESVGNIGNPKNSTLAIIALVAGILGIFFIGSLVGIVCGHIARYQIRNSNGTLTGDGMALAGLVLGYIGLVIGIISFFLTGAILLNADSY